MRRSFGVFFDTDSVICLRCKDAVSLHVASHVGFLISYCHLDSDEGERAVRANHQVTRDGVCSLFNLVFRLQLTYPVPAFVYSRLQNTSERRSSSNKRDTRFRLLPSSCRSQPHLTSPNCLLTLQTRHLSMSFSLAMGASTAGIRLQILARPLPVALPGGRIPPPT